MAYLGELITWRELTGTTPTRDVVHEHLAPYALQAVLLGLARLSAQLNTWQNQPDTKGQIEATRQTLPTFYVAINALMMRNPHRVILDRITILYVAKQALLACKKDGREVTTQREVEQIMTCCLMANDLLLGRMPAPDDKTIEKAASLLPFSNYVPQDTYPADIGRTLLLLNDIAPQLANRPDYRDLTDEFTTAANLTPQHFCELVFCAATKFLINLKEQNNPAGLILDKAYFQHTTIPTEQLDVFLNGQTTTIEQLQTTAQNKATADSNFLIFQDRPLIEFTAGHYLCIDPGFLLEKAGKAFYWTLHNSIPKDYRQHLLGYWASVIDQYAQWVAEQTCQGTGAATPAPQFLDGAEAADIMIREGTSLILLEVKASTLTANAKYGFDAVLLKTELLSKAIQGDHDGRKGVAQLHHNLIRFLDGDPIHGINATEIAKVYPVLVFLDDSFVGPYLSTLYREHFDHASLRRRRGPIITSLYTMTIGDLENLLPHTHKHNLSDIFDEYYQHNRTPDGGLVFGSLGHGRIPFLIGEKPGKDIIRDRFHQFGRDLIQRAFPGTPPAPNQEA